MNWQCFCGNLNRERRVCSRCGYLRFKLERPEVLDHYHLNLGTVEGDVPFNLPLDLLGKHAMVSGQTGTGKSRFAMNLAVKAENHAQIRPVKLLIMDVEGEWGGIASMLNEKPLYYKVGENLRINPFDLEDPALIRELFRETVFKGIEKEYSDLSAQMNYVLNDSVARSRNMMELIDNIKKYQDKKLSALDRTKTALLVRLDPFLRQPLSEIFLCKKSSIDFKKIGRKNIIINLHDLDSKVAYNSELRLIYNTITTYYLREMLDKEITNFVSNLFFADEAQLLVPKILQKMIVTETWPVTEFATRLRKRGCGMVLITQSPSNIEKDIFKNCKTKVTFCLQHLEDIQLIADSCGFTEKVELQFLTNRFVKLHEREAIVCTSDRDPFLIASSEFKVPSETPMMEQDLEVQEPTKHGRVSVVHDDLTSDHNEFLSSIAFEPFISVRKRIENLNWGTKKFYRIAECLVKKGMVESKSAKVGKSNPVLYQKKGQIPSVVHEFYVDWIVKKLEEKGIECRRNVKEGADIVVPETRTCIEVELGKSDMVQNIEQDVQRYDSVIVCSPDSDVLRKLKNKVDSEKVRFALIEDVPNCFHLI